MNFHVERRSNATHASTTDPEARLMRKGNQHEAKLSDQGHVLMENRHGFVVDGCLTQANGIAERETALAMATNLPPGATLGADKGYDTAGFVAGLRTLGVTPHVAQHTTHRRSAIDGRTTRHGGYAVSQRSGRSSRRSSAGRRLLRCSGRPAIGVSAVSAGCSPSRWRSTTWSACGP